MPICRINRVLVLVIYAVSLVGIIVWLVVATWDQGRQVVALKASLAAAERRCRAQHDASVEDRARLRRNLAEVHAEVMETLKRRTDDGR